MAFEVPGQIISAEGGSTTLAQFRFVRFSSTRENAVVLASLGGVVDGVLVTDYDSTEIGQAVSVQISGVAKVEAAASTIAFGDLVQSSTIGRAEASTAGAFSVGRVVGGSSGGAGRILSILLAPVGTT